MTRAELAAFDRVLAKHLQKDKLLPKLKEAIQDDYNLAEQGKTFVNTARDNERSDDLQNMKKKHGQRAFNKRIKDEDAYYKELAFDAIREKRTEKKVEEKNDLFEAFSNENFELFYKS